MLGTFLAVCTMGLAAAAACTGDNIDGSCLTAESSSCITECARREFNASCSSTPGCTWSSNLNVCRPTNATLQETCSGQADSTSCASVAGCYWEALPCQTRQYCQSMNTSNPIICDSAQNASSCAARGSHCQMTTFCTKAPCARYPYQTACLTAPGCFWTEYTLTAQNFTEYMYACVSCLADPLLNAYSLYHELMGQSCTVSGSPFRVLNFSQVYNFSKVVAAPSGCDGGTKLARDDLFGPVVCTSGGGSTTAPTPASGANDTDTTSAAASGLTAHLPVVFALAACLHLI